MIQSVSNHKHVDVKQISSYFISFTKLQSTNWLNGISFVSLSLSFVSCTSSCTPLSEIVPSSLND